MRPGGDQGDEAAAGEGRSCRGAIFDDPIRGGWGASQRYRPRRYHQSRLGELVRRHAADRAVYGEQARDVRADTDGR